MITLLVAFALGYGAQAAMPTAGVQAQSLPSEFDSDRTPTVHTHGSVLIQGGKLLTVTHGVIDGGDVLILNGKIVQVGKAVVAPSNVTVIDAHGKFVTPGIVDAHSHRAEEESNEWTDSVVAEVRIWDAIDPDSVSLYRALASGITTELELHGSADPIGGQSVVIKNKWRRPLKDLIFPGAPRMIKFALGENPRGVNGRGPNDALRYPISRFGVESVYRRAFADAKNYMATWDAYRKSADPHAAPPRRDLRLETIADILQGNIWVQVHSYRQDEMLMMLRLSQEFGFHLVLQHALESYKIAPELAKAGVGVSMFGDGQDYKLEVVDSMPMATEIADAAGVTVSVNTDTSSGMVPLTQDAGRAMRYGMSEDHALRMLTMNPAKELGVEARVGSLDVGKDGDIAIWSGHPLSVYSKCDETLIEGEVEFQRRDVMHMDAKSSAATTVLSKKFNPETPLPVSAKSYLIKGASVHPVRGKDLAKGDVLIVGGKIAAVGESLTSIPAGAVEIDGRGLQVYPGLIDGSSQLGLTEIGSVPQASDLPENGDFLPDLWGGAAVNPESVNFPKARYNGITSTFIAPSGSLFNGQGTVINTAGFTIEEMSVEGRAALVVSVPAGMDAVAQSMGAPEDVKKRLDAIDLQRNGLRKRFEQAQRYWAAKQAGDTVPIDTKLEAMGDYVSGKKPVLFLANDRSAIRYAVKLSDDLKLKPIIGGGTDAWKIASFLAAKKVPVLLVPPTISCPDEDVPTGQFDPSDSPLFAAAVLRSAGVKLGFCSFQLGMAMNLPYRVGRACAFGLSKQDALRGLTLDAAEILGVGDKLGSLEPGKMANVIVTDGDPMELTTQVKFEFIAGKPVSLATHYTDLYKKYMARVRANR